MVPFFICMRSLYYWNEFNNLKTCCMRSEHYPIGGCQLNMYRQHKNFQLGTITPLIQNLKAVCGLYLIGARDGGSRVFEQPYHRLKHDCSIAPYYPFAWLCEQFLQLESNTWNLPLWNELICTYQVLPPVRQLENNQHKTKYLSSQIFVLPTQNSCMVPRKRVPHTRARIQRIQVGKDRLTEESLNQLLIPT